MQLTVELATDYSMQAYRQESLRMIEKKRWQDFEPWRPFFWLSRFPTGIYLQSERRPVLFPSGHQVDEEIYFAILLSPDVKPGTLRLHRYAFRKNPEKHTKHSVHREGYWHFDRRVATSLFASIAILKYLMYTLELLAFYRKEENISIKNIRSHKTTLSRIIAWEERLYPES